jgi:nitrite reductase (NADH) small subunit
MPETLVGTVAEFEGGTRKIVEVDGVDVGVFRHRGKFVAFENRCLHQGGPVCEGILIGQVEQIIDEDGRDRGQRFSEDREHLVCPWHGWEYEISTGRCAADRRMALRAYRVQTRDDRVYVSP